MTKPKVTAKLEKQYGEYKVELERVTNECRNQQVQANKQLYLEKLEYAKEILQNMNKIKPLSRSNRVGLKFIETTLNILRKSTSRGNLLRAVNPMRMHKYHRMAKREGKKDVADGVNPDE